MPYDVRQERCRTSSGKPGKFVVFKPTTGEMVSCHTSRTQAQAAVRARYASEGKNTDLLILTCKQVNDRIKHTFLKKRRKDEEE